MISRLRYLLEILRDISFKMKPEDEKESSLCIAMQALPIVMDDLGLEALLRYLARVREGVDRKKHRQVIVLEREARAIAEDLLEKSGKVKELKQTDF